MKFINTIKNYFKNNELKKDLSLTSIDNVLDKNTNMMYDRVISDLKTYVDTLVNYNTLQVYDIEETTDFYCGNCKLIIVGNIAYVTGSLYSKTDLQGSYEIPLPFLVFPKTERVWDWSPIVVNGVTYKQHTQIETPDYDHIFIYFYDEFPANNSIPINLIIPLSDKYKSHTE